MSPAFVHPLNLRVMDLAHAQHAIEFDTFFILYNSNINMSSKGLEKTLQKLRDSVNAGNYYEAQQMYRTVARR